MRITEYSYSTSNDDGSVRNSRLEIFERICKFFDVSEQLETIIAFWAGKRDFLSMPYKTNLSRMNQ